MPRKEHFFIEVRFRVNDKAHSLLKKIAEKQGNTMASVCRQLLYSGLWKYLEKNAEVLKKGTINDD